ncbi:reverse transcriptase domain-containing protein [Tanacetum coccineum]
MSTHEQASQTTSAVHNIVGKGKEQVSSKSKELASDAELWEYFDKHYHQLLPFIAERVHQRKKQQDKLKELKAYLNFEGCLRRNLQTQEVSQYSESGTPDRRRDLRRSFNSKRSRTVSRSPEPRQKSSIEDDDLSQSWVCEENDPFTPRIRHFDLPKRTRMPSYVNIYDKSEDPEDHLNFFQAASKFDDLPPESVDSYDDLKEAFLANFCQQNKCIKNLIDIHHIKQREGESMEDFVRRFKLGSRDVKGAPKCMRISGFMHEITNPELIKRLHDKILKLVDEMMKVTTYFLRGEVAADNLERKKLLPPWKQQDTGHKQSFKKRGFKNQQRSKRRHNRFTILSKYLKEILPLEKVLVPDQHRSNPLA